MAKTRVLVEFGMGTSLRREDYTEAARRCPTLLMTHWGRRRHENSTPSVSAMDFTRSRTRFLTSGSLIEAK